MSSGAAVSSNAGVLDRDQGVQLQPDGRKYQYPGLPTT
jgi:hypothetical protein